jgi:hypothetical protein
MVSLPLLWFFLSINFNCYIGTCLGTEGTPDAAFRVFHTNNIISVSVILGRIGQYILGTESQTQSAAFAPFSIDYCGSSWHTSALLGSILRLSHCSPVLPDANPHSIHIKSRSFLGVCQCWRAAVTMRQRYMLPDIRRPLNVRPGVPEQMPAQ